MKKAPRYKKYFALTKVEKRCFRQVVLFLIWARFMMIFVPFKRYSRNLGNYMADSPENLDEKQLEYVTLIKKSLQRATKTNLFFIKCLQKAYVGKVLLSKNNIPSTVYFGVRKSDGKKLKAHAWLRAGEIIVTGEQNMARYKEVAKFS